jgi:hypothetical protein
MLGNYRVAAQLVASRVVLSSTELVHLLGWSGTKSTINEVTYWPIVPALDDRS